jgi:hypothetical protein
LSAIKPVSRDRPSAADVSAPAADTAADNGTIPTLTNNQALVIARADRLCETGNLADARRYLVETIASGNWGRSKLWWRLVALIQTAEDYATVRDLWLRTPSACHEHPSILRAVARAAAVCGHHDDCRTLLRKAILVVAAGRQPSPFAMRLAQKLRRGRAGPVAPANTGGADMLDFVTAAAIALADLNHAFAEIGLKAFLISGTLLGQVREGDIIGWDKDIDVGIFREDCHSDLEKWFSTSPIFRVGRVDLSSDRVRAIHENGTWIDIFPHYMEGDKRWHDGTATRWWNTPFGLRTVNFLGIDQYIPDDPERYLDENYGDWRTPNSHFDARMDAPNVEVTDREHFISLLYFSLEKSVRTGKQAMTQRYVALLREQGEGAWLEAI